MTKRMLFGLTFLIVALAGWSLVPAEAAPAAWLQVASEPEPEFNQLQPQYSQLLDSTVDFSTLSGGGASVRTELIDNDVAAVSKYTNVSVFPVPEPTSLVLIGLGLVGSAFVVRRRQR